MLAVRRSLLLLSLALLALGASAPATAAPAGKAPEVAAPAGVVIDAGTGAVLWGHDHHDARLVASTTKILTAIVAHDAYKEDKVFVVPEAAVRVDGTRFGYQVGMKLRRNDLLATLLLVSANDAAETLAAAYRGGREGFLRAMQETAGKLGCTDSTWRDPSGLDAPGHEASAADLALLGKALLERPKLAKLAVTATFRYRWPSGRIQVLTNHNRLVSRGQDPGALGIKTGYTTRSKHTIVAAQRRDGRTVVAVALGSPTLTAMYADARALLGYGFSVKKPPAEAEVLGTLPEANEAASSLGAVPAGGPARAAPPSLGTGVVSAPLPLGIAGGLGLLAAGALALVLCRRDRQAAGLGLTPRRRQAAPAGGTRRAHPRRAARPPGAGLTGERD